jgi:DMSO reductase anchor subunit
MVNIREWALPVYTILMQMASGAFFVLMVVRSYSDSRFGRKVTNQVTRIPVLIIFLTTILAMIGAQFHLSKPWLSVLAVTNFRTSWLSREIIGTLLFFLSVGALMFLDWFVIGRERVKSAVGWFGVFIGSATIYCMSRIYILPSQAAWNSPLTVADYFLGMIILGVSAMLAILLLDMNYMKVWKPEDLGSRPKIFREVLPWLVVISCATFIVIAVLNVIQLISLHNGDQGAQTSFALAIELYLPLFVIRLSFPFIGMIVLVVASAQVIRNTRALDKLTILVYLSCMFVLIGEVTERFLFYATHVRIGV